MRSKWKYAASSREASEYPGMTLSRNTVSNDGVLLGLAVALSDAMVDGQKERREWMILLDCSCRQKRIFIRSTQRGDLQVAAL